MERSEFVIPSVKARIHKTPLYVGIAVTAVIALLPKISDFFIAAFILGAFAAVWFAGRSQRVALTYNDGAELGFLSGFCGLAAATTIYDTFWQFFHYELWQPRNFDYLWLIFAEKLPDLFSLQAWILITIQFVFAAIFAGIFGAPSGLLAVKVFRRPH